MRELIHIFGASGSGTTTLGKTLAQQLGYLHLDTDDYYWAVKYSVKRPQEERLRLMQRQIQAVMSGVVLSGSLVGWGDELIPQFTLAIRLYTDTGLRIERLKAREYAQFGQRICQGGSMYQQHQAFLTWAEQYDDGPVTMRSRASHDRWQTGLRCPILHMDGSVNAGVLVQQILERQLLPGAGPCSTNSGGVTI